MGLKPRLFPTRCSFGLSLRRDCGALFPLGGGIFALVVEVKFLAAGDGFAVEGGGGEEPLLNRSDDSLVDGGAEAVEDGKFGDVACFVDDGVEDDVAAGAGLHGGEIGGGVGVVNGQGDAHVALAEAALDGVACALGCGCLRQGPGCGVLHDGGGGG